MKNRLPNQTHLDLTLTADHQGNPLVIIESGLMPGLEATPARIRAIAAALCTAAKLAEERSAAVRAAGVKRIKIDLANDDSSVPDPVPTIQAPKKPLRRTAVTRSSTVPSTQAPRLLDTLRKKLQLKSDAELARLLDLTTSLTSRIRNGHLPVGASVLLRMHEISGLSIAELKSLLGQAV
jgi:hypothetical protein